MLYAGERTYNIPAFFAELAKGLNNLDIETQAVKQIKDTFTVAYNTKVAEEKRKEKEKQAAGKKGKDKARLALDKASNNMRNNNPQMVADLMGGDDDDYGDEYGDYGDEGDESGTKAN